MSDKTYDPTEQDVAFQALSGLLRQVLKDGGKKRAAGEKPPWWADASHDRAIFSHIYKRYGLKELRDKDSGAHPLVHLACRALMQAWQETEGKIDPAWRAKCAHPAITDERLATTPVGHSLVCPQCATEIPGIGPA